MLVRDIMTYPVKSVRPDATIQAAADMMSHFNVGVLPVCVGDVLVGILTDRDIVLRCVGLRRLPLETTVTEVMSKHPTTIDVEASVEEASRQITINGYRRLPVTDDGRLVGIVSSDDVARYVNPVLLADMARHLGLHTHAVARLTG